MALYRGFENAFSFYNANSFFLKTAAGTLSVFAGFILVSHLNVHVLPPLERAAESVLRLFEEGRGLEPLDVNTMVDRKDLMDSLNPILRPLM